MGGGDVNLLFNFVNSETSFIIDKGRIWKGRSHGFLRFTRASKDSISMCREGRREKEGDPMFPHHRTALGCIVFLLLSLPIFSSASSESCPATNVETTVDWNAGLDCMCSSGIGACVFRTSEACSCRDWTS